MTFESIILKLAPFTYINQSTQEVHWGTWSNLTDGDKIITSVEVFLIFLFTWYMIKLIASWWKDKKQIVILSSLLEKHRNKIKENYPDGHLDISNEYAELLEEINESNPKLQKLWKEFDESLIKKTDGDKFIVRNSIDAEYFFNKKTMISHLGSKLFGSIPGMLLGIGLLGTFTGLYFALIQMDVTNVDKLQESIKVLINMAGVKFAASIWGLGLSVLFTFVDKLLESGLEKRLDRIQIVIDQIFIRETAEQNLDSILLQNTQQTKALNGLATSLTEKIAAEFNTTLIPKIELMNNQFNSMPQHISEAISDTFQKPLEKLSDTVENLTQNQSDKSNEALENLLKGFITELKSAAGDEGEKMKVASEQSQDILKSTSEQLHNTFTSMQKMFQEQESISTSRDNKILEDLQKIKNDQQDMIQNLSSNVSENITNMNNEVSNNINNLVDTIQTISSNQTKLSNDREESLQASQANMVTNLSQSVSDNMNNINSQVSNNINNLVETIQNTNQKQQESSEQRENEITKSVNTMLSNIETSMTSQIEDDKQRNKVVINMLEEIGNQNKELITEISSTVSGQMNSLNNNSKELFEKLISQFDSHIDNVKSSVDSILINLKTEVQNIDTIMSSASKQLVGLPSHLEKVSISTDKLLQFSNDLTESTSKLIQFNSDFVSTQKNLDEYSKNILQSSEELKEADTNLKETLNNSKELLSDMKNQFEELTDKNSKTIDTFGENVDKFMNDYHKHVETAIKDNIVHQLDTSLASYAHTMAEAITSLSDAIDELREKENN